MRFLEDGTLVEAERKKPQAPASRRRVPPLRAAEEGMLLLCSTLGDESSRPLSYAQFRTLAERARALGPGGADLRRDLTAKDLTRLGYAPEEAEPHRRSALAGRQRSHAYLSAAERRSIFPLTRITPGYPAALRALLGDRAPLVLFLRGEPSLLELPCISVVGSRQPNERTRGFARRIGALAAKEGFVLCSGGAGGVDTEAEDACLGGGGRVIVFPAGAADGLPRRRARALSDRGSL